MKITGKLLTLLAAGASVVMLLQPLQASAASFNPHRIIDDMVFDDSGSMNSAQIDAFLNTFGSSCISPNHGFSAPDPTGYSPSGGYTFGGNVTAGAIIMHAAQAYDINPRVLLVTLQKEQGLVSGGSGCSTLRYTGATGYGCPDGGTTYSYSGLNLYTINGSTVTSVSGTCVNSSVKAGFSQQLIRAAWLLKFGEQRSKGNADWAIIRGSWDNSDDPQSCYGGPMTQGTFRICPSGATTYYDGWRTIDGTAVHMETGGTASLYWYTPHLHGNQNFFDTYTSWFGVPYANANDYSFVTSSATTTVYGPGGEGTVSIVLKNMGFNTWYSDTNLPGGQQPTRLATIGYQNSEFLDNTDASTLFTRNQVRMSPDVVQPGENATFTFKVSAPYRLTTQHVRLVPIIGGAFLKDIGMDVTLTTITPGWNPTASNVDTRDLLPNQQSHFSVSVQNNSDATWYSDGNTPANKQPTRIATIGYQDSPFADTADPHWLGTRNQIKMNETSVAPGQTATFDAYFIAPIRSAALSSAFHFFLINGGVFTADKGLAITFTVPAANLSYTGAGATNPPATMTSGQTATATYNITNTGNVVWQDEVYQGGRHSLRLITSHPTYHNSSFYDSSDSSWLGSGQIKKTTGTVWPGQTATFTFNWKAPVQTGAYTENFMPSIGGLFLQDYGAAFPTTVQ